MFSLSPYKPPIDSIHSGMPLRAYRPDPSIHPFLHDVDGRRSDTSKNRRLLTAALGDKVTSSIRVSTINSRVSNSSSLTDVKHDVDTCQETQFPTESSTNVRDTLAKSAEADAFARLQAATDAWLADPTPANKNAMIDANMKWHKMGGVK